MQLPAISLPQINLPFDIPTLLHPAVVHFVVAIPVVILLLEFYNLFTRRKSIGAFSFVLLVITVLMLAASYLTGSVDGKEAYALLSADGQAELKAHKLLGVYVLFSAVGVMLFKLLAMTGKGFFKFFYFLTLIGLIAITLNQGKEGGELVYEYGANVERVQALNDDMADLKEELEELNEEKEATKAPAEVKKEVAVEVPATIEEAQPVSDEVAAEATLTPVVTQETNESVPVVVDSIKEVNATL